MNYSELAGVSNDCGVKKLRVTLQYFSVAKGNKV